MLKKIIAIMLSLVFTILLTTSTTAQNKNYPAQYISKLYTEGLGRVPDQAGYFGYADYFKKNGCNTFTLKVIGWQILTSKEFKDLNYNNDARIVAAYRALLNREPDKNTDFYKSYEDVIQEIYETEEFNRLVAISVCRNRNPIQSARYGWRGEAVDLGLSPFKMYQSQLETLINFTPEGGVVWLPQKTIIFLDKTLNIKKGVTLQTIGYPKEYLNMARIVRMRNFPTGDIGCGSSNCGAPLIKMQSGSSLKNIWIDGNGEKLAYNVWDINIQTIGSDITISDCRVDNAAGFSNIQTLGALEGIPCGGVSIKNNLIVGYNGDGYPNFKSSNPWTDGVTASCENSIIEQNQLVDLTDVAIVIFNPRQGFIQNSKIINNIIFNSGNSSFAGLNTDHIFVNDGRDFSGTVFENNMLWTSDFASMRVGISVGSDIWGSSGGYGWGAQYIGNNSGTGFVRGQFGILVAGMRNSTLINNSINFKPMKRCQNLASFAYAVSENTASFNNLDRIFKQIDNLPCQ